MLYDNLITLKQKVITIRQRLGDTRLKELYFEYPAGQYFRVTPKLPVMTVPKNMIGLPLDSKANIMISADDYYVKDVSRNVPEAALRTRAWLDPVFNDSGVIVTGVNCRCHVINDKSGLSWDLILRKEREVKQ